MGKLKPCPFCGGRRAEPVLVSEGWAIECQDCMTQAGFDSTAEKATRAWNRRALDKPTEEDVERVARAICDSAEADDFDALRANSIVRGLYVQQARAAIAALQDGGCFAFNLRGMWRSD